MRSPVALATAGAAVALASGCGGGLSETDKEGLRTDIEEARAAARAGDRHAAREELRSLRRSIRRLVDDGRLDRATAMQLLDTARQAQARVPLDVEEQTPQREPPSEALGGVPPSGGGGGDSGQGGAEDKDEGDQERDKEKEKEGKGEGDGDGRE